MKKLVVLFFACSLCIASFAQNKSKDKMHGSHAKMKAKTSGGAMMKDGKMMMMKDGKWMDMDADMTMSNGTMVMMDGSVKMKDGKTIAMQNGDMMSMGGKMTKMKMSKEKMKMDKMKMKDKPM